MKAEEIRPGIMPTKNYEHKYIVFLEMSKEQLLKYDLGMGLSQFIEFIEPIPLTGEILHKIGYIYDSDEFAFFDDNNCISDTNETLDYWVFIPFCTEDEQFHIRVKYIHEIHNIHSIYNQKELKIKLP